MNNTFIIQLCHSTALPTLPKFKLDSPSSVHRFLASIRGHQFGTRIILNDTDTSLKQDFELYKNHVVHKIKASLKQS
jgi:hypothetical protein